MLTKTSFISLMSWELISERFIAARFRSRARNISIIQCYTPTELASNTEKDDFYIQLSTIYDKTTRGDNRLSKKSCGISTSLSLQARSSSCIRRIGSR